MKSSRSPKRDFFEEIALLGGLSLFLSVLEFMIPKPLPFMRLGIANVPILIALFFLRDRDILLLGIVKILGQGLLNGTLLSYIILFSSLGTMGSVVTMLLLRRFVSTLTTVVGIGVAGAFAGNLLQIAMATVIIFGDAAILIAPPFLGIGLVSSIIIGIFTDGFAKKSKWLYAVRERSLQDG